jgi:hypothetical protein
MENGMSPRRRLEPIGSHPRPISLTDRRRAVQQARLVGTVAEIDLSASTVVLADVWDRRRRHPQLSVVITAATTVTLDGRPGTLDQIGPADQVVVSGVLNGQLVIAWELHAVGPFSMAG